MLATVMYTFTPQTYETFATI